jgi:CRP-like cAMP-binding protein/di/tricarboxylate transporter
LTDSAVERANLLAKVELFSGLDRLMLARLAADLDPVDLVDGQAVVRQGEPGDSLYVVARGHLGVFMRPSGDDQERQVATIPPGACFGEIALLTGESRSATVRALGPVETLRLDRARFVEILRREPLMGLTISATLSRRLVHANQEYLRAEELLEASVDRELDRLPAPARQRVLRATLLDRPTAEALEALFGGDAPDVAAHLAALGFAPGAAPPAAVWARLRQLPAADPAHAAALDDAIDRLAAARLWEDALALAARAGPPARTGALLARARADPERFPPERAAAWLTAPAGAAPGPVAAAAAPARHAEALLIDQLDDPGAGQQPIRATPRFVVAATVAAASIGGALWSSQAATPQLTFLFLLCAAIGLWVTAILPEFAVAIGLATGWIVLGVADPAQVLAGYGSPSWATALAILGLGSAISTSGLLFRVGLLLLRRMPHGLVGQAATFLFTGVLLTPLLPSSTARGGLTVPLAVTAASTQRLQERSPESALLGMSAYIGANPLLFAFLNGSTSCLLAIGLLPEATRQRFDFAYWFVAALPLTLLTALGSLVAMLLLLRPGRAVAASDSRLTLQLSLLGRPTARELAMAAILALTVVGWNVAPALGLGSAAVSLLGLVAAIVTGCFTRASLQLLNWDFLVSYGVVLSLSQIVVLLGIDDLAAAQVADLLGGRAVHPLLFVLTLALLTLLVRVFLPQDQALLLIALAIVPSAPAFGVDPWIVAITILATFSTWFYPSQTIGYPIAFDASEGRLFTHTQARLVCLGFTLAVLLALALSVPYWRLLGLL